MMDETRRLIAAGKLLIDESDCDSVTYIITAGHRNPLLALYQDDGTVKQYIWEPHFEVVSHAAELGKLEWPLNLNGDHRFTDRQFIRLKILSI